MRPADSDSVASAPTENTSSTARRDEGGPLRSRLRSFLGAGTARDAVAEEHSYPAISTAGSQEAASGDVAQAASSDAAQAVAAAAADPGRPAAPQLPSDSAPSADSTQETSAPPQEVSREAVSSGQVTAAPAPLPQELLTADIDQALSAALGGASLDEVLHRSPAASHELEIGSRLQAVVVRADREYVFFSLGGQHEAVAPLHQFPSPPQPGTQCEVVIRAHNVEDDLYEVTVPGAVQGVESWDDVAVGTVVEARVTGANTGGLECMVNQIRGFIPASQIALYRVEHLTEYIGQKLLCVVTEANRRRKNLVLSRRAILEREKEEARRSRFESLQEGDIVEGVVRSIQKFGVFVDLGGIDGLIHISQLSWEHVDDPTEIVQLGQRVRVRIEKIDRQTGKIGLSLRSLQEHPWEHAAQLFPVGSIVKGTVTRLAKFGAFVKLAPGIEGLIHISELSHQRVPHVGSVLSEGQEVQVKVIALDTENQRIGLSLKALAAPPSREAESEPETAQQPRGQQKHKQRPPLKGGLDRPTGGDQFGLRW